VTIEFVDISTNQGRRQIFIDDDFVHECGVSPRNMEGSKLFILSWLALLADSPISSSKKPLRLFHRFLTILKARSLKTVVLEFSELAHRLVSQTMIMGQPTIQGEWISSFKDTPVFFEYYRYFSTGDADCLKFLYTFLNFGKKLEYVDETFDEVAFRDWSAIEDRLAHHSYDEHDLAAMRLILGNLLPKFQFTDLRPKFGPGSVAEKGVRTRTRKLERLAIYPDIERFLLRGHIGRYGEGEDFGLSRDKVYHGADRVTANGDKAYTARLHFVPKSLKTSRSISMEPNTLMYWQQGVMSAVSGLLRKSLYKNFFTVDDQGRNQRLALIGSFTSEIDTLDLSAASDSLTYKLVKSVFPASWVIPLSVTRSKWTLLPNGKRHRQVKFAPMGSALCFPVQSIIFSTVCIYAAAVAVHSSLPEEGRLPFLDWLGDQSLDYFATEKYGNIFRECAIYGDDICVDRKLTHIVEAILHRLGFVVNTTKSFRGSQAFRESCGKYYLNGDDITPLYFRVKTVRRDRLTPNHVMSQVHLANEAYRRHLSNLRRNLIRWLGGGIEPIPFVAEDSQDFGFITGNPGNSHLRVRFNPDYQREEFRAWAISSEWREENSASSHLIDSYEYMRWWSGRRGVILGESHDSHTLYDTGGVRLQRRWIPLY